MRIAIIGCGAISELYYVPAIHALQSLYPVEVSALVDPSTERLEVLGSAFPSAQRLTNLQSLQGEDCDGAILASPSRFHAAQAKELIGRGIPALIEKPLAHSEAEALEIAEATEAGDTLAAVGMFRRFWPFARWVREAIAYDSFGHLQSIDWREGGPFDWPAATTAFFEPEKAGGGILLDIGSHVLDLLIWWLEDPASLAYGDDNEGGLESNCLVQLEWPSGTTAQVRLSRDWPTGNEVCLAFENAEVRWSPGDVNHLRIRPAGISSWLHGELQQEEAGTFSAVDNYHQSFTRQLESFILALDNKRTVEVTPRDALRSMRLISQCYAERQPLAALTTPTHA